MNVPNMLTMVRFALIPVFVVFFAQGLMFHALAVWLTAGATDILDGYVARKTGQVTVAGSMLDPLADKLMMITVVVSLMVYGLIPWQAVAAIFARDGAMILLSVVFHFRGKRTVPANWWGKMTTVAFYVVILLIVWKIPLALKYLWIVIMMSCVTSIIYIFQFRSANKERA